MSGIEWLGVALVALPFVAVFVFAARVMSVLDALGIFALAGLIFGCVWLGVSLMGLS